MNRNDALRHPHLYIYTYIQLAKTNARLHAKCVSLSLHESAMPHVVSPKLKIDADACLPACSLSLSLAIATSIRTV